MLVKCCNKHSSTFYAEKSTNLENIFIRSLRENPFDRRRTKDFAGNVENGIAKETPDGEKGLGGIFAFAWWSRLIAIDGKIKATSNAIGNPHETFRNDSVTRSKPVPHDVSTRPNSTNDCTKPLCFFFHVKTAAISLPYFVAETLVTRLGKRSRRARVSDGTYQFSVFHGTFDNCRGSNDKRRGQRLL